MCGICGFVRQNGFNAAYDAAGIIERMTTSLFHRGPDGGDTWISALDGVALGHRRLAILDLSPNGAQPMVSNCGRYVIVFNGEVYNHGELRERLASEGASFTGSSDTETILEAFSHWGVRASVAQFIGMFAIALWDKKKCALTLIRDRVGIKPLYYGFADQGFVFGSELKAIMEHPGFSREVDRNALALFFRHNYVPAPFSIFQNVRKLGPGEMLELPFGERPIKESFSIEKYWSLSSVWGNGELSPLELGEEEAVDQLENLLSDAIGLRLLSDVPLGAFLSGGIDSSAVVALAQKISNHPVKTFSIGFEEEKFNEAHYAKAVADHLGCNHTEYVVSANDLLGMVTDIPTYWDEPFSDSSQIPTYCVSKLARQDVTVVLSGDGGDELFSGYERYFGMRLWDMVAKVPLSVRRAAAGAMRLLPRSAYSVLGANGERLYWRIDALRTKAFQEFYLFMISHHKAPEDFVLGAQEQGTVYTRDSSFVGDRFRRMSYMDMGAYLPDDILTKVDRASMAVSLEARVPLLDHRVVEFAAQLPTKHKVIGGQGKQILRKLLNRYVPDHLIDRPKMGFGVPIGSWLRKELRDWCEELLSPQRIKAQGYLDAAKVERMWSRYLQGEDYWHHYLWDVLMFQAWLAKWGM